MKQKMIFSEPKLKHLANILKSFNVWFDFCTIEFTEYG